MAKKAPFAFPSLAYLKKVFPTFPLLRGDPSLKVLHKKNFEDNFTLKKFSDIFTRYRQTPFTMPSPNKAVILLCSGGIDSVVLWEILLRKYKLKVFPLRHTTPKKQEEKAFQFFLEYFRKKYPKQCQDVFTFGHEFLFSFQKETYHLFEKDQKMRIPNLSIHDGKQTVAFTIPITRLGVYALKAYEYALYLRSYANVDVQTAFVAITPEDSAYYREATLTVLRSFNLSICTLLGDYRFQFTSPYLEKSFPFKTKLDIISFAKKTGLPLEMTWSCTDDLPSQCGECFSCLLRKRIFDISGIKDKTTYGRKGFWISQAGKKFIGRIQSSK
ncbi:7-cyano-7-deazaguanine synthase [Candidatus Gottesmanbacteria bacterium]|nr:7-cyano-7-deazaguanine synthase [Candidatus Gottesmanbacteria bacterium]